MPTTKTARLKMGVSQQKILTFPSRLVFAVLLVLAASSIGAVNEIIEFAAVVLFQADGVGGYHNTCIDLVANLLGAIVSTVYLI